MYRDGDEQQDKSPSDDNDKVIIIQCHISESNHKTSSATGIDLDVFHLDCLLEYLDLLCWFCTC